jgi:cleavage and polyadenylation specificity factor subunit 3
LSTILHLKIIKQKDLQNCVDKIEVVDYHQTIEHNGIKFTATAAGHVLGAAMFMIDIDGIRVLYTGDYSLEEDRFLFYYLYLFHDRQTIIILTL